MAYVPSIKKNIALIFAKKATIKKVLELSISKIYLISSQTGHVPHHQR